VDIKSRKKQEIYNRWHKEIYQLDVQRDYSRFAHINKTIVKYLEITKNSKGKLLDVPCGKGLTLKAVSEINNKLKLYGSDISDYAVSVAKKLVKAKFSVDNAEQLSFKSNQFDFVVCAGGLEYYNSPTKGAREIARVLKKNGRAIIFVPNLMFLGYIWLALRCGLMPTHGGSDRKGKKVYDYNDEKFFTFRGWTDVLKGGGLKIIKSEVYSRIGGTKFANEAVLWLYNKIFYRFIPFNLSYSFIFICKKNDN